MTLPRVVIRRRKLQQPDPVKALVRACELMLFDFDSVRVKSSYEQALRKFVEAKHAARNALALVQRRV